MRGGWREAPPIQRLRSIERIFATKAAFTGQFICSGNAQKVVLAAAILGLLRGGARQILPQEVNK
jgi:hypothetical protein